MAQLNTVPFLERVLATNEQVTKIPARKLIEQVLDENANKSGRSRKAIELLDNACGSGILLPELLQYREDNVGSVEIARLMMADIDPSMTMHAEKRNEKSGWDDAEIETFDQQSVPLPDDSFTHITNNFGVFFSQDDRATLSETFRLLKPGGTAGFTSWKTITWFHTLAVPAIAVHIPEINGALPDPVTIFPSKGWHDPNAIRSKLDEVGFEDIAVTRFPFTVQIEHGPFAEATAFLIKSVMKMKWPPEDYDKYARRVEPAFLRFLTENFPGGYWNGQMEALVTTGKKSIRKA